MDEATAVLQGTLKHPKPEPLLEGAAERIHAAVRELKEGMRQPTCPFLRYFPRYFASVWASAFAKGFSSALGP